jgi:hypothetical protein
VECENSSEAAGFEEATSGHTGPICNDCNEVTPRLARVAKNALLNGDFPRVIAILDELAATGRIQALLQSQAAIKDARTTG